jgi:hypothetical protein
MRKTFTQKDFAFVIAAWVDADLFTQINTVGGAAVAEQTAVAVIP